MLAFYFGLSTASALDYLRLRPNQFVKWKVVLVEGRYIAVSVYSSSSRTRTRRSEEEEEENKYMREEDEEEQLSRNSIYLLASRIIPQIKAFHRGNAGFREFIREIRILLYFSNTLNLGRR